MAPMGVAGLVGNRVKMHLLLQLVLEARRMMLMTGESGRQIFPVIAGLQCVGAFVVSHRGCSAWSRLL